MKAMSEINKTGLTSKKDLSDRFCTRPFSMLEIHKEFYCFPCCPSWLPEIVGNYEKQSLMDVWNSPKFQKIRASILDGSFRHCDQGQCPHIQQGDLPKRDSMTGEYRTIIDKKQTKLEHPPIEYALCYDESCNLACPSCRPERRLLNGGPEYERRKIVSDKFLDEVLKLATDRKVILRVTGSGDPFASKIFNQLLTSIDGKNFPNLHISIMTNGLMFTPKVWDQLSKLHCNTIWVGVSIDAASSETYSKVRKFGEWSKLVENLGFLSRLRVEGKIAGLQTNFVAQTDNFHEIPAFARFCLQFPGINAVFYSLVTDWGSWKPEEFKRQSIWRTDHSEFRKFIEVMKDPVLGHKQIQLGNLSEYRNFAQTS